MAYRKTEFALAVAADYKAAKAKLRSAIISEHGRALAIGEKIGCGKRMVYHWVDEFGLRQLMLRALADAPPTGARIGRPPGTRDSYKRDATNMGRPEGSTILAMAKARRRRTQASAP